VWRIYSNPDPQGEIIEEKLNKNIYDFQFLPKTEYFSLQDVDGLR
jgi:hypothetical protein